MTGRWDEITDDLVSRMLKEKAGRKARKFFIKILVACVPFLLILFMGLFIGSGVFSAFSAFGGFVDAITGKTGEDELTAGTGVLDSLSLEELIALVRDGKIEESFYNLMMIDQEEFLYLLERVYAYNTSHVRKTIYIEAKHVYQEWKDDGQGGGAYETKTDYEYRPLTVDSKTIEKFQIDWQLVYMFCLSNMMQDVSGWQLVGDAEVVHYGASHAMIDDVIEAVSMKYEYIYDLARVVKDHYAIDECRAMVHTPCQYGDPDTESGQWTYYVPHSVLSLAYSGYSCMYYQMENGKLTHLITAADMRMFDLAAKRFCYDYNFGYVTTLLAFLPGGGKVRDFLVLYDQNRGGYIIRDTRLTDYTIGTGTDTGRIPVGPGDMEDVFGDIPYGEGEYDDSIGSAIVRAARKRIGCAYSQVRRWEEGYYDCSSFVWRILAEIGINLNAVCNGSTAAAICEGMVNAGMAIKPSDIKPGDILFFSYEANGRYRNISHTAVYAGNGRIIHARGEKYGVCESAFSSKSLVCVCRPY